MSQEEPAKSPSALDCNSLDTGKVNGTQTLLGIISIFPVIGPAISGMVSEPVTEALSPDNALDSLTKAQGVLNGKLDAWRSEITKQVMDDTELLHSLVIVLAGDGDSAENDNGIIGTLIKSHTVPLHYVQVKLAIYLFFLSLVVLALVFLV